MEAMTTLPDFQIPKIAGEDAEENKGTFTIEPLDKGFGYTFGNSLRRVLLSSLGGAAITSVRIEGVAHEFSTIPGLKEDVTDLVLNLKDVVVRMHTDADEVETPLVATGPGEVKAKDIDLPAGVEILNPEAPIATLEKKTKLEMYLTIGRGRGYSPADENKSDDKPIGVVPIDAIFSPIRRAAYSVDSARVGQRTDFDKLTLEVETDGSIEPGAALREAAEILIKSLAIFTTADRVDELRGEGAIAATNGVSGGEAATVPGADGLDEILIEELELGVRSYNCLKRAGIQTVGELVRKSESELNAIPNFGRKSIEEVQETLRARGLSLRPGLGLLESRPERRDEAPAQESQAEPGRGSPQVDASNDVEAADRARADPYDPAEGEGAAARVREADHARPSAATCTPGGRRSPSSTTTSSRSTSCSRRSRRATRSAPAATPGSSSSALAALTRPRWSSSSSSSDRP